MLQTSSPVASRPQAESLSSGGEPHWFALYTCARHEKRVTECLKRKNIESFLPCYQAVRRWKKRRAVVQTPLFPGYVFVRTDLRTRRSVLEVPGVVRLVGDGRPVPLPDTQIEMLRAGLASQMRAEPHPYLKVGRKVLVTRGPLIGAEGILLRKKDGVRVVLSLDLIMRSVAVEVDVSDVEPV